MIITTSHLTAQQIKDLHDLEKKVAEKDGCAPHLYTHLLEKKRECEGSVLYYEADQLVGFLAAYFFYEHACEISMIVHPDHRRKNISIMLLKVITPLLEEQGMENIIFSMVAELNDDWIVHTGFSFRQSDYHMDRFSFNPLSVDTHGIKIRKAEFPDVVSLVEIEAACFKEIHSEPFVRYANLVYDPDYTLYIAHFNQQAIGKAHVRWEKQHAQFFDIGILPQCQGKGFGTALVAFCINECLKRGKSKQSLDVISDNHSAIAIYNKLGFKMTTHHAYWQATPGQLAEWIRLHDTQSGS